MKYIGEYEGREILSKKKRVKGIVCLLHGYGSDCVGMLRNFRQFSELGYDVISLNSLGHGKGHETENPNMWKESINHHRRIIENINLPIVLIGHSMGATMAINLSKCKNVFKVFSIASPYDSRMMEKPNFFQKFYELFLRSYTKRIDPQIFETEIKPILPINITLTQNEIDKLYLIHSRTDAFVPFSQFQLLKQKFRIKKSKTYISDINTHVTIKSDYAIKEWIEHRLKIKR